MHIFITLGSANYFPALSSSLFKIRIIAKKNNIDLFKQKTNSLIINVGKIGLNFEKES